MRLPVFNSKRTARAVSVFALAPLAGALAASTLETMDAEVSALYENTKDAIIRVHAASAPLHGLPPLKGTGFFLDGNGRFVTCAAVVENAQSFWIQWRGRRINARLLGTDPLTNLAFLQADAGQTPSLPAGNSDELRVGSMVVAIGFPYDLPSAPVVGFVTGLDISCGKRVFPVNFIRAGCRLRRGQSGSPILNSRGQAVGVVVAAHGEDQCYAVPMAAVKKVYADLLEKGQPQYGWVGLSVTERRPAADGREADWQVLVQEVASNSPAAAAGFQNRDVLLRICTNEIRRSADVLNTMFFHRCGEPVTMTVLRDGATQEVTVVIGQRAPADSSLAGGVPSAPVPVFPPGGSGPTVVPASAESPR
jgi:serine protease Do